MSMISNQTDDFKLPDDFKLALDEWETESHWNDKEQHDLISRRFVSNALLEKISKLNAKGEVKTARELIRFKKLLDGMTAADRPTGEWVRKYDKHINCYWYECNQCGEDRPRNVFGKEWSSPYCPNCGARMEAKSET